MLSSTLITCIGTCALVSVHKQGNTVTKTIPEPVESNYTMGKCAIDSNVDYDVMMIVKVDFYTKL